MKKSIYFMALFTLSSLQSYSQANTTVDETVQVLKTVNIGSSTSTKYELNVDPVNSIPNVTLSTDTQDAGILFNSTEMILGSSTSDITFRTNNTTSVRIKDDGKMGVGTNFPDARLHVSQAGSSNVNNPVVLLESVVSKQPLLLFSEGGSSSTNGMALYMNGSPTQNRLHVRNSFSEDIATFSNLGKFGIGVVGDPKETLEVNGNIQLRDCGTLFFMDGGFIRTRLNCAGSNLLLENLEPNGDIKLLSNQRNVVIRADGDDVLVDSGDDIAYRINGENKMFFRPSGRLGINDTSPSAMLHIKQESNEDGLRIQDNANSDDWSFEIGADDLFLKFNDVIKGSFNDSDGAYIVQSDRRLKNSILELEDNVLEKLLQLQPSSYNYIHDETKQSSIGFIAQEVKELFPMLVDTRKNENGEEYYSVAYDLVNVLVIKAIQKQHEQKEILKNKWNNLQNLEAEMAETNALISSLSKELRRQELNK